MINTSFLEKIAAVVIQVVALEQVVFHVGVAVALEADLIPLVPFGLVRHDLDPGTGFDMRAEPILPSCPRPSRAC